MPNQRRSQEDKEMMGTARKDRVEGDFLQPQPVEGLPEPPSFLNKTGRKPWKRCTKLLQNEGILPKRTWIHWVYTVCICKLLKRQQRS